MSSLSLLETVCLFFLVDLSLEFSVNTTGFSFFLIVKLILDYSAQMLQKPNRTKCRRPIAVGSDAVQKLLGVGVSMLCGRRNRLAKRISASCFAHRGKHSNAPARNTNGRTDRRRSPSVETCGFINMTDRAAMPLTSSEDSITKITQKQFPICSAAATERFRYRRR